MSLHTEIERLGVYQVYTGTGTGSGFLIDDRHLLTNSHVVSPFREVAIELRDRGRVIGRVRRLHPQRDLAIVELEQPLDGEVLALAEDATLSTQQPVHILGYPVGLPLSLTEGVVSHPRQLLDDEYFVQTDAAINPGNSGGPILDDARRVVAVTTCKLNQAESVGFGIPIADARAFIEAFRAQSDDFGVQCVSCEELITRRQRYCPSCGTDLDARHDFLDYFDAPEPDPVVGFIESALRAADVDPVLARHGDHAWSFHQGSAPIRVWRCCSEHVNFSANLALTGNKKLQDLFRHLLAGGHAPFAFDLCGSTVRMLLVLHIADVYASHTHGELSNRVQRFLRAADEADDRLIRDYGCQPTPDTREDRLQPA